MNLQPSQSSWIERLKRDPYLAGALRTEVEKELCRRSLSYFVRRAWPIVEPSTAYVHNWHIDAICAHLEAVTRGEIKRLLINVPPRHGKSLLVSVLWPAWTWIQNDTYDDEDILLPTCGPSTQFLCVSYQERLSTRDNVKTRKLIDSRWYKEKWGHLTALQGDVNMKTEFRLARGGFRISTSVNGFATGEGAGVLILDDPLSANEAKSETDRENRLFWFAEVMPTRLNDQKRSARVMIMQRLHERDPSGYVLAKQLDYVHLCYDAETEVLTRNGWVKFPNLPRGVEVMAVDPGSLCGRWEMPTAYIKRPFDGEMVHFKSQTADLMVTPEHRVFYKDLNDWKRGDMRRNWRVRQAKDLPYETLLPQALMEWHGKNEPVLFAGKEWQPEVFAEFMGWYLAEGCASGKACLTRITQSTKSRYLREIRAVLAGVPFRSDFQERNGTGTSGFQVWGKALAVELEKLGKCKDKHAPPELKDLHPMHLERFIMAYVKGDGHFAVRNGRKVQITTISERMAGDLQECAAKCGWATSLSRRKDGSLSVYIRVGNDGDRKWYSLTLPKHRTMVPYRGDVYCVSVPATGLLVRRNGRITVSGNCLPLWYEPDHPFAWPGDPRTEPGEILFPQRFGPKEIEELTAEMTEYAIAGQLQQRPAPRGGGMFKRQWFSFVDAIPAGCTWVRAWDLASTEKNMTSMQPDYTAGILLGRTPEGRFIIANAMRFQEDEFGVERIVKAVASQDGPLVKIRLPQDPGSAGKSWGRYLVRRLAGYSAKALPVSGSKVVRAEPVAAQARVGNVLILRDNPNDPWNQQLLDELCTFPNGTHDDWVDALSDAFDELTNRKGAKSIPGAW